MAVNKVDLYVSQIKELLDQGYTWLEKDNLGYGSIETKYGANAVQIAAIRKHPKLKDLETNITIFNIIDDESTVNSTKEYTVERNNSGTSESVLPMVATSSTVASTSSNKDSKLVKTTNEAADLFAQL